MLILSRHICVRFSHSLVAAALIAASSQAAAVQYSIKNLGLLPNGTFTIGTALNNSGQVVGFGDLMPQFNDTGERTDRPFAFISGQSTLR